MPSAAAPASASGAGSARSLRGRLVTLEGIDGCGKTTQAGLLEAQLTAWGLPVHLTREPGGTAVGARLRQVLLDPAHAGMAPYCELLLYVADRVQHLHETIRPRLERGEVVLCDRFHDATVAYQGYGRGLDLSLLAPLLEREVLAVRPALTLWIDVPARRAVARIAQRRREAGGEGPDPEARLENEPGAFHERVVEGYRAIHAAEPERVVRIDGEVDVAAVHQAILQALRERFDLPG